MKRLSDCPQDENIYNTVGRYTGAIVDDKTGQRLELSSQDPFIAISFKDGEVDWGRGQRPDGVLIADVDDITWVCFVEMKGKLDVETAQAQLKAGVDHFAPARRGGMSATHGDEHHDAWTQGEDLLRELMPTKEHRVLGLFVTCRQLPRTIPPSPLLIHGKRFVTRSVQMPKTKPNHIATTPRELLKQASVL